MWSSSSAPCSTCAPGGLPPGRTVPPRPQVHGGEPVLLRADPLPAPLHQQVHGPHLPDPTAVPVLLPGHPRPGGVGRGLPGQPVHVRRTGQFGLQPGVRPRRPAPGGVRPGDPVPGGARDLRGRRLHLLPLPAPGGGLPSAGKVQLPPVAMALSDYNAIRAMAGYAPHHPWPPAPSPPSGGPPPGRRTGPPSWPATPPWTPTGDPHPGRRHPPPIPMPWGRPSTTTTPTWCTSSPTKSARP